MWQFLEKSEFHAGDYSNIVIYEIKSVAELLQKT